MTMEFFANRFLFDECVFGSSAGFRCIAPITTKDAGTDLAALPLATKMRLLERAAERVPQSAKPVLMCGQARCLLDHGEPLEARKLAEAVTTDRMTTDPVTDFHEIALSNKRIVLDLIEKSAPSGDSGPLRCRL
jgi:hypothetical protein